MGYPEQCVTDTPCPHVARVKAGPAEGTCPDCGQTGQLAKDTVKPEGSAGSGALADPALDVRPLAEDPHPTSGRYRR